MTITFRPIPKPTKLKADTRALKQARIHTHKQLENELKQEKQVLKSGWWLYARS